MPREKTHVRIGRKLDGGHSLTVDGVEMSDKVLADGFTVQFGDFPDEPDRVTMTVAADVLDIDLPAAVVEAMREERD